MSTSNRRGFLLSIRDEDKPARRSGWKHTVQARCTRAAGGSPIREQSGVFRGTAAGRVTMAETRHDQPAQQRMEPASAVAVRAEREPAVRSSKESNHAGD